MAKRNEFKTSTEEEMLEVVGGYFNPLDALKPTPQPNVGNYGKVYTPILQLPPHY